MRREPRAFEKAGSSRVPWFEKSLAPLVMGRGGERKGEPGFQGGRCHPEASY